MVERAAALACDGRETTASTPPTRPRRRRRPRLGSGRARRTVPARVSRIGCGSSTPHSSAWPGTAWPRPRWTTSPARPGCPGPPCTGSSPAGARSCSAPSSTPRWPGCSPRSACGWARPRDLDEVLVGGIAEASTRIRGHRGAGVPGGARARDGPRPSGLRRVRPAAGHRLPVRGPVPGPLDDPGRGRAGGRMGDPHRAVLRHRPVDAHGSHRPGRWPGAWSGSSCCLASGPCTSPTPGRPSTSPRSIRPGRPPHPGPQPTDPGQSTHPARSTRTDRAKEGTP